MPEYTLQDVAKHNTADDLWIVVENNVYDVTKFAKFHPGGLPILVQYAGTDCTKEFKSYHNSTILQQEKYTKFIVGSLVAQEQVKPLAPFKYADPAWHSNPSPYFSEFHHKFKNKVRAFVEKEIIPYVNEWEKNQSYPPELRAKAVEQGLYASIYPKEYGGTPPNGESYDAFCDLILVDELSRCGAGGVLWSCFWAFGISIPPIIEHGSDYIKDMVLNDVLTGKKTISLCVTEPSAGSDSKNVQTTAVLKDGNWIINGCKRYITGGILADYYTVVCKAPKGVTLILVPRNIPGVSVRKQPTQGWASSNTAFIQFNNVSVPAANIIGNEGDGFKYLVHNFNHERFVFATSMLRFSRVMMTDAVNFIRNREVFGKTLSKNDVIRAKVAEMVQRIEVLQSYSEHLTFLISQGKINEIGGDLALFKARATECMDFCARESMQCLGGCGYIVGGTGDRIERLYREVRVNSIAGGSYEIMCTLAMKQAKL